MNVHFQNLTNHQPTELELFINYVIGDSVSIAKRSIAASPIKYHIRNLNNNDL